MSWSSRRSSKPSGRAMPASRKIFRLPDFVPCALSAGSTPLSGIPRRTASLRSRGVELNTVRYARARSAMPWRMRSRRRGRSRIFSRERARRRVVRAQQRQPASRVARGNADEELEVVLEDERMHGLRRHEDDARPRIAKPDEKEQEPLLVEARTLELPHLGLVEGERRDDDRGVGLLVLHRDRIPDLGQARFQGLELGELLLERERGRERRAGNQAGPILKAACTRQIGARFLITFSGIRGIERENDETPGIYAHRAPDRRGDHRNHRRDRRREHDQRDSARQAEAHDGGHEELRDGNRGLRDRPELLSGGGGLLVALRASRCRPARSERSPARSARRI